MGESFVLMLQEVIKTITFEKKKMKLLLLILAVFPLFCIGQNLVPFEEGDKMGYKDEKNKVIIKPEFDYAMEFSENGIAAVVINSEWWYINVKGEKLIQPMVVENGPDYFSEGWARFVKDGKIGFFDEDCKIKLITKYEYVNPFSSGLAAVNIGGEFEQVDEYQLRKGGAWGYINTSGELIIPAQYDYANDFENGFASVTKSDKSFYINIVGNIVTDELAEKAIYGEELAPKQAIEDGLGDYAEETSKQFEDCLNNIRLEISNRIAESEILPEDLLKNGLVCFDEFFQSMKGNTNYTSEVLGLLLKEDFHVRKQLHNYLVLLGNKLEKEGNTFKTIASSIVDNPVNNWKITVFAFSQILVNSKDVLFCLPAELAKNLEYTNVSAGPEPPVFVGIKDNAMFFLQQGDFSENNYYEVFENYFGKKEILEKPSEGITSVIVYAEYLQILANEKITKEEAMKLLEKYKDKALYIIYPHLNQSRVIPASQLDINYSWE